MKYNKKKFVYLISPSKVNKVFYNDLIKILSSKKVSFFQLRLKKESFRKRFTIGKKIKKICKKFNVKFLINDDVLLAKKLNADGCHLGQKDMNILDAKRLLADSIDSEISSRMEDFLKSTGTSSNELVKQASEIVTKNTTVEAKLVGYKQVKTEAVSMNDKFQFYVLLEYPIGQANQALLNQIKKDEILSTQKKNY